MANDQDIKQQLEELKEVLEADTPTTAEELSGDQPETEEQIVKHGNPNVATEDEAVHVEGVPVSPKQSKGGEVDVKEAQEEAKEEIEKVEEETTQPESTGPITDEDDSPAGQPNTEEAKLAERGGGSKKLQGHVIITKSDDERARWFVVHTTSGHEARIAENLRQRVETMGLEQFVLEILIPTQDRVVIRGGKKYTVKEKIFPGYMIVKMILTDEAWLAVRTTQGVTGFVGAGNKPSPLSEMEVQNITKFVAAPAARYKVRFSLGEAVRITDGPFSQFLGTISEMDEDRGKVKVLVSIFGRETPVELDFLQIAKV